MWKRFTSCMNSSWMKLIFYLYKNETSMSSAYRWKRRRNDEDCAGRIRLRHPTFGNMSRGIHPVWNCLCTIAPTPNVWLATPSWKITNGELLKRDKQFWIKVAVWYVFLFIWFSSSSWWPSCNLIIMYWPRRCSDADNNQSDPNISSPMSNIHLPTYKVSSCVCAAMDT